MWSSIWYISRYLIRPLHRVGNQNINRMQTEMDGKLEKGKINKKKSTKQQNNGKEKQKSVVNRFPWVRWKVYAILGHCVRAQGWMHRHGAQDSWEETWNGKEWVRGGGEKMGQCSDPHRMLMKGKRDESSIMGMSATACLQTSHWYYNQGVRRQRFQCQPEICCGCS